MKKLLLTGFLLCAACSVQGKDKPDYEKGVLLQMDSTACGIAEKDGKSLTSELIGTDSQNKKTQQVLCQEYILQFDKIIYGIRPKDDKHPALLPIGETAKFRIHKDKLLLLVPEGDGKEREYVVVSMTPRGDTANNQSAAKSPNN
ncbi:MAG TPA: hypothetical protein VE263_08275 [Candidatus Angelobacter sp.]|nr:hypothetical protein [Candidatus Angelobacter sp.]